MSRDRCFWFTATLALLFASAMSAAAAAPERGVMVREATIYISPDTSSAKLSNIGRGREVSIMERTPGWAHVVGTVESTENIGVYEAGTVDRNVTGWMMDKGIITAATPNGDKILLGEAFDSELEASHRGGRHDAAQDALRLYSRTVEYFPNSSVAAEALYRAADIRWQFEAADASTRPSAKLRDPAMHHQIDEQDMKQVMKKFPHTKWSDLAAYHLIENKLCGDWEAQAKCPDREADIYMKYAEEHPQSPKAPEALYKAAWRVAALIVLYHTDNQPKKAEDSVARATATARKLITQYPNETDWASRAERLIYMVEHNIPTYGPDVD